MKKIVSIVLALVLVLAIAAPAMAITGYELPVSSNANPSAPFAGGIFLVDSSAAGLGILGLNAIATNKAYLVNEVVYGRVNIDYNPNTTWNKYDTNATYLTLSSDCVDLVSGIMYKITSATSSSLLIAGGSGEVKESVPFTHANYTTNTITMPVPEYADFVALFSGVVKKAGNIYATLRGGNPEVYEKFADMDILSADAWVNGDGKGMLIYDDLGVLQYDVQESGTNVVVLVYNAKGTDPIGSVTFVRDGLNNCTAIWVDNYADAIGGQSYTKTNPISTGAVIEQFSDGTVVLKNTDTGAAQLTYNGLKAIYDEVMSFFGFDYDAKGLLLDGHFVQKLHSFNGTDKVEVALYTGASLVVPDPEVEIPQTGDAATTIGFVMVAMAIVAAAAVAYKKVRA